MKTTSFEISKKLVEIGFKKESDFQYYIPEEALEYCRGRDWSLYDKNHCSAYDLETILEALPEKIRYADKEAILESDRDLEDWYFEMDKETLVYCRYEYEDRDSVFVTSKQPSESLADTAARLLLMLHEKGIINFNKFDEVKNV